MPPRLVPAIAVLAAFALAGARPGAQSAAAGAPPTARVPVVVELFTSEGCSSCPPADKVLIDLMASQPVDRALIIGLSEHVDYWDNLGWKDPFSDHLFTARQSGLAAETGSSQIYTPEMVVDGGESFVGSDRATALAAIARAAVKPKAPLTLAWAGGADAARSLNVTLSGGQPAANAEMLLAIVEDGLSTPVRAGENSGHVLAHGAVARKLVSIGHADRDGHFTASAQRVDLAASWHARALRVVVLAQASHHRVVAAGTLNVQQAPQHF